MHSTLRGIPSMLSLEGKLPAFLKKKKASTHPHWMFWSKLPQKNYIFGLFFSFLS